MDKFPALYNKSLNLSRKLKDAYEKVLEQYDILILPTTSFVAKRHGPISTPIKTIDPTVGLTANTVQFDVTGQPALSIPIGWLPAKEDPKVRLLVAMQIVSGVWSNDMVLKAGYAWENAFNWKMVDPSNVESEAAALTAEA
jgi:amidase